MKWMKVVTKFLLGTFLLISFAACSTSPTKRTTGVYFDDTMINTKVKTALTRSEQVKARQLSVETYKGVVQLSGFVSDEAAREAAGDIAEKVEGVIRVQNDLLIR